MMRKYNFMKPTRVSTTRIRNMYIIKLTCSLIIHQLLMKFWQSVELANLGPLTKEAKLTCC